MQHEIVHPASQSPDPDFYRRKALFLPAIECGRCSGVSEDLGHIERRGLPLCIFNNVHVLGVGADLESCGNAFSAIWGCFGPSHALVGL